MANPMKGEASAVLGDGTSLTLVYDFNALCEVEEAAGKSISEVLAEISKGSPRLSTARALVFGGLRARHPEMTLEEVGPLIMSDGQALTEAMQKALLAAFPNAEGKKAGNAPKPRRGTGSAS